MFCPKRQPATEFPQLEQRRCIANRFANDNRRASLMAAFLVVLSRGTNACLQSSVIIPLAVMLSMNLPVVFHNCGGFAVAKNSLKTQELYRRRVDICAGANKSNHFLTRESTHRWSKAENGVKDVRWRFQCAFRPRAGQSVACRRPCCGGQPASFTDRWPYDGDGHSRDKCRLVGSTADRR